MATAYQRDQWRRIESADSGAESGSEEVAIPADPAEPWKIRGAEYIFAPAGICRSLRPPPYHPGLPRKGRIYVLAPARWEDSRAIEPYRILEAGASLGLPERPEMRDTLLFSIKKDARSAKIQLQSNPHLRTHKISPGVRRSCPPRGCYPGTTGRSYGHLGLS